MGTQSIQIGNGDAVIGDSEATYLESRQMYERAVRNSHLADSDSKVLTDRGLSESDVAKWKTYRQELRDMDFSDPDNLTWPTKP